MPDGAGMAPCPIGHDGATAGPGPGREYTVVQLAKAAFGQLWLNKRRVLATALGVAAVTAAVDVALGCAKTPLLDAFVVTFHALGPHALSAASAALNALYFGLPIVPGILILEAYKWSIIRSFDHAGPAWSDLSAPLQRPWRGSLLRLACLLAALSAAQAAAYALWMPAVALSGGAGMPPLVVLLLAWVVAAVAVTFGRMLLTMLAGPAILQATQPTLLDGLRQNWRILRGQPRRMVAVAAIGAALFMLSDIVADMVFARLRTYADPGLALGRFMELPWQFQKAIIDQTVYLAPLAVWCHLVAVLFRSAHGLPLEPSAHDPETDPSA